MDLQTKILHDMNLAQKNGDPVLRRVTRMLLSELDYARKASAKEASLDEQAIFQIIDKYKRQLSQKLTFKQDREFLRKTEMEIKVLDKYLEKEANKKKA